MEKLLIYAVDDEESILDVYSYILSENGFDIECFLNGKDMFASLNNKIPDLFILDIMIDEIDGFEILKRIRKIDACKLTPVIMVSAKGEELIKVKGLTLGADDYIEKPFKIMEFIARVKSKLKNIKHDNNIFAYKEATIDSSKHEIFINQVKLDLTLKEYDLLCYLLKNNNHVIEKEELWINIWKDEYYGETRTMDIHISQIRKKLIDSSISIETIRSIGYILK